jgi:ribonuclease J
MGRAMRRMVSVAVETGVLTDFPSTISPEEATQVPRENLMLIVTGSQGERRGRLRRPCRAASIWGMS